MTKVNNFYNIDSDFLMRRSNQNFKIISESNGSLGADINADESFERVHVNVSSNSVDNVTGSKQFNNPFSSSVENIIDVDVSHTSDSCSLSHQSKFLNIYILS